MDTGMHDSLTYGRLYEITEQANEGLIKFSLGLIQLILSALVQK